VENNLYLETDLHRPVMISDRTAIRWIRYLEMDYLRYSNGLYIDGHERLDVVEHGEAFLKRMLEYANNFFQSEGDDMKIEMAPVLQSNQRPLVWLTNDESCFSSHDGKATIRMDANDRPLRPKGQGRSIVVSEFLCECHGPMKLNEAQRAEYLDVAFETCAIIQPGKHEGYWITANLIEQVKTKAMPIFMILHPEADAICLFDNSQNHRALPPDVGRR
jgi:hypothetical protein